MKNAREGAGGRIAGMVISVSIVVLAAVLPPVRSKVIPGWANTCLGWRPLTVLTNSMEGTIRKNAVVVVYAAPWDSLKLDDVITFELPSGELDTHRVIAKDGAHITTRGDNAAAPDAGWVTPDSYRYKVMFVWNGMAWLSEHRWVAYLACITLLAAVLATAAALLVRRANRRKNAVMELPPAEIPQAEPPQAESPQAEPPPPIPAQEDVCVACLDELIDILDPLLALHEARPRKTPVPSKEKEKAYEPQSADEDGGDLDSLDWDAWALRQLRRPAPPPGNPAPGNRGADRPGALPGKSAEHGQQLPVPG
jgi:hypothetical protein